MTRTRRAPPRRPPLLNRRTVLLLAFAGAFVWSLDRAGVLTGAGRDDLINAGGWALVRRFFAAGLRPDLSPDLLRLTLASAGTTLAFAVCGTVLAVGFGLVAGLFASETWWRLGQGSIHHSIRLSPGRRLWWLAGRGALALPRGLHEAVWGLLLLSVLGLDPLVAILAIAVPYGAITAKVYAEILDETPHAALGALAGGGVPPFRALLYGLLPPAAPALVSYGLYRLECALRSAAVLGLIGAGGLGYQILLSLQSLRYEQVWTFLYALIVLVAVTDAASTLTNRLLNVPRQTEVRQKDAGNEEAAKPSPRRPALGQPRTFARTLLFVVVFVAIVGLIGAAFRYSEADLRKLTDERTVRLAKQAARDLFPPQRDAPLLRDLADLSLDTLAMSLLAIGGAALLGLIASLGAAVNLVPPAGKGWARRAGGWLVLVLTRGALLVARALSESVWALIVLFVLFPGILPGAVALALYNAGVLGRLMAEVHENADERPRRALHAQGARGAALVFYALLPVTLPRCLAYALYRWEVCVRATAVVGIVGAGGLGRRLSEQLTRFDYPAVTTTLLFFVGLTFLADLAGTAARRALR